MTLPSDAPESEGIQQLLAEVRRTLCDNQSFLKKLKDDDADLDVEDAISSSADGPEEQFEEL
jgi:hypothetical protein